MSSDRRFVRRPCVLALRDTLTPDAPRGTSWKIVRRGRPAPALVGLASGRGRYARFYSPAYPTPRAVTDRWEWTPAHPPPSNPGSIFLRAPLSCAGAEMSRQRARIPIGDTTDIALRGASDTLQLLAGSSRARESSATRASRFRPRLTSKSEPKHRSAHAQHSRLGRP
jgi:hypothetical protein